MSTVIAHHPDGATLMAFAAGSLGEPLSAVVAAHASQCPSCRRDVRLLERLGGGLIDGLVATAGSGPRHAPPTEAEAGSGTNTSAMQRAHPSDGGGMPSPLLRRYGLSLTEVPWRRIGPGAWTYALPLSPGAKGDLRLIKIAAGKGIPAHGHGGAELTLVLDGAFHDSTGRYAVGDVQDVDADIEHRPVAEAGEDCICIVASERPAQFTGLLGRFLQPFVGRP